MIKTILCVDSTDFVASVCGNRSHQITQALQLQMQVQKQLHEQLEVSLSPSIVLKLSVPVLGVCNHPLPLSPTSLSLSLSRYSLLSEGGNLEIVDFCQLGFYEMVTTRLISHFQLTIVNK
jgi:hypothetical protein